MTDETAVAHNGLTMMHLLLAVAFFMPAVAASSMVKNGGGGIARYLLVVPSALVLGAFISFFDWKLAQVAWLKCERYSRTIQNAVSIALFGGQLLWILIALLSGEQLGTFNMKHVAR